jgi:hypothetical protein
MKDRKVKTGPFGCGSQWVEREMNRVGEEEETWLMYLESRFSNLV